MYATVLVNHNYARLQKSLTYKVPENVNIEKGCTVIVPFQNQKKAGLVVGLSTTEPSFSTKYIEGILAPNIFLKDWQFELANWIADYYFCSDLDIFRMMLPTNIWKIVKRESKKNTKDKIYKETADHTLTADQEKIVNSILSSEKSVSLIYAITGAGKTEMYKKLIQAEFAKGKQSLLLVPEISLTPQLVKYFEGTFKNISVIHSKISEAKRAEEWKKIHSGESVLIIGSRSSLFYPFKDLGLIVMDEEHEWSYKQESSPRYHARDVALKISEITKAKLVFGSATPSVETMYRAKNGDYDLYTMKDRIHGTALPNVEVVDMREELKKRNFSIFSDALEQKIASALANKEQVILFLNRRGSASASVCRDCGLALSCKNCDSKLTYHTSKFSYSTLVCHHCGITTKMPDYCPNCNSVRIKHFGIGTEKVELELKALFPNARVARADRDTMNQKDSYEKLHEDLNAENIDILIGTQMIGKGFDIAKVSLVGVILADLGLHIPDFRAAERSFQLLTQVAGRAGRREKQGEVLIQTYSPEHISIKFSKDHDYDSFYEQEISSREKAKLPPFGKCIKLMYSDKSRDICIAQAEKLLSKLSSDENHETFIAPALIEKINNKFHWNLLIQGAEPATLIKKLAQDDLTGWKIDVDPVHSV